MRITHYLRPVLFLMFGLSLSSCGDKGRGGQHENPPSSQSQPPGPAAQVVSSSDLVSELNWNLPGGQQMSGVLPPQPGSQVMGKTVKGGPGKDTNWTAFTLVLHVDDQQNYSVLTQKRAISPVGVVETPGGHLTGGQSWGEGAATELFQESGIKVLASDLIFLKGGVPKVNRSGSLYGNANFVVLFKGGKPATTETCHEIDKTYGHKWQSLRTLYQDMLKEQNSGPFKHGQYYSFFRGHVIDFCQKVLNWQ